MTRRERLPEGKATCVYARTILKSAFQEKLGEDGFRCCLGGVEEAYVEVPAGFQRRPRPSEREGD